MDTCLELPEQDRHLSSGQLTALSYSLLAMLNNLTKIDTVLFSDTFCAFLFNKDVLKFTQIKPDLKRPSSSSVR